MQNLSIQRVMLLVMVAMLFTLAVRFPTDTDTWWHIRSGEHTLTEGMIYSDPFSFTKQGEEWINHSWGTQIILYVVYEVAGNAGLSLYAAVLATGGMWMLYQISWGNVYLRAFVLVLGAATAAVFWSPRPHMMSFFLSTVILYLLFTYKYRKVDRLWFIVPLMLIWGNLHAGFSIGYIFIGGFIAGEIMNNLTNAHSEERVAIAGIRKLIIVSLVSVAALVVNPYGFDMLLVPFQTVGIGALRDFIQEWNSPNFQERQTWPFILLLFGTFGAVGASNKRLDWTHFILMMGTAFMALTAGRNIAVFAVVTVPVMTYHLDAYFTEKGWIIKPITRVPKRQARLNLVILIVVVLGALLNMVAVLAPERVDEAQREALPVQVAEFLNTEQPEGPMFNSYNWGGYLMFAAPDYPVYTDGRTDLYKDEFLTQYIHTATGREGWQEQLDADGVNLVVVESGSGLARQLADDENWTLIYPNDDYPDEQRVIYQRQETE